MNITESDSLTVAVYRGFLISLCYKMVYEGMMLRICAQEGETE